MKFIRPIFETLCDNPTITADFLRFPSIRELKKLKRHICNAFAMMVNIYTRPYKSDLISQNFPEVNFIIIDVP